MGSRPQDVRLAPLADSDLEEIWLYTRTNWSAAQADRYIGEIVDLFEDLRTGRKTGRPVDVRDGYLKASVGAHVIFYRLSDDALDVIRILHQRMDVARHL